MTNPSSSRVWFVTGCSTGLGHALAGRALARGDRVVATARRPEQLEPLVAAYPEKCRALALDVIDPSAVKDAIAEALKIFGRIDVVVNNAGYGVVGALEELDDEQVARNFDTNFFGALAVIRASLPTLRAQRSGHIVNISAAAANRELPGLLDLRCNEVCVGGCVRSARRRTQVARNPCDRCPARAVSDRLRRPLARTGGEANPGLRSNERQVPSPSRNDERQTARRPREGGGRDHCRGRIGRSAAAFGSRKVRKRKGAQEIRRRGKRTRCLGARRSPHGL